ncbi:DUF4190 domain-containing protein [Herbiconiux liangxiaofengii]|uniref:DUF4190 domain-containing protein n=1 Tax=Herbiconiux liangxiaofengii TaxID=3342795 RepID=UPI0035BA628F
MTTSTSTPDASTLPLSADTAAQAADAQTTDSQTADAQTTAVIPAGGQPPFPTATGAPAAAAAPAAPGAPGAPVPPAAQPTFAAQARTNVLGVVTLVLGILGFGLVPVITGHIALSQIKKNGDEGRGITLAGLILGYITLAGWIAAALIWIAFVGLALIAGALRVS